MRMRTALPALLSLVLMMAGTVLATEKSPRQVIVDTIDRITTRIEQERKRLEKDPEYAREVVREELVGLVDFKRITRLVMAEHFSRASREQKYEFLEVFKRSLINTYASGLTMYEGQTIEVEPLGEADVQGNQARVRMKVATNSGKMIPVLYTLVRDEKAGWQVQNVIVNGLNLGKTFRAQFDQAMQAHQGDIDQVIANWSPELNMDGPGGEQDGQQGQAAGQG